MLNSVQNIKTRNMEIFLEFDLTLLTELSWEPFNMELDITNL